MAGMTNGRAGGEYTVSYADMRGVDFSSAGAVARNRFSYLENMYKDYDGDGGATIESVPGFRKIAWLGKYIYGMYHQKIDGSNFLIVHSDDSIYHFKLDSDFTAIDSRKYTGIAKVKSNAFHYRSDLYILDGEKIIRIDASGNFSIVGDANTEPYIPTTYVDGVEYEQRNLLTDKFKEKTSVAASEIYTYGTHGIEYRITDSTAKLCAAVGIANSSFAGVLYIPSYVKIGGEYYKVKEIADGAFKNHTGLADLKIAEGVTRIGRRAFYGCTRIRSIYTPESLSEIDDEAFAQSSNVSEVYLGTELARIGQDAFKNCSLLTRIYYAATASDFTQIEGADELASITVTERTVSRKTSIDIPVNTSAEEITEVTLNGEAYDFLPIYDDDKICSVLLSASDGRIFEGKEIVIHGIATPHKHQKSDTGSDLLSISGFSGTGFEAVVGCRICTVFDGRIFLAGNPALPNTVIYSELDEDGCMNPLYFGAYDYFNDGIGSAPIISMQGAGDALVVFKAEDDGGGIFYHTPADTGNIVIPRVYPISYIHSGVRATGASVSFLDEVLFISPGGLSALEKQTVNLERSIGCRSHNVNPRLLAETPENIIPVKWCGYLALCVNGHIYLADSRAKFTHMTGDIEYEWFYLSDIGVYENATQVYRYASCAPSGYAVHKSPGEKAKGTVMSTNEGNGMIYYTEEDGIRYALDPTEEMEGGKFSPLCSAVSFDEKNLIFGTTNGFICVFNNDKRGKAPPHIKEAKDFNAEEYAIKYGRRIHPYYYSFNSHAPRYVLKTALDNGGIPHLTKNTVKNSLTLKCRMAGGGELLCEVVTDHSACKEATRLPCSETDFSELDFSSLALETAEHSTLPLTEKEKGWIEKQVAISTDGFNTPIGIFSITYRFGIRGRIKRNR